MSGKSEYTVADISNLIGVHRETVKRWLRNGLLKGEFGKYGYLVKADDLFEFINFNPKYRKLADKSEDRAFVNFCKEMLFDIQAIDATQLAEEHGKMWRDGFETALKQMEKKIKDRIIERDIPKNCKSRHYAKSAYNSRLKQATV